MRKAGLLWLGVLTACSGDYRPIDPQRSIVSLDRDSATVSRGDDAINLTVQLFATDGRPPSAGHSQVRALFTSPDRTLAPDQSGVADGQGRLTLPLSSTVAGDLQVSVQVGGLTLG